MSGRTKMIIIAIAAVILLSIISFLLLAKFYPPLNRYLFGGEFEISYNDIQFWVKKVPERNYYRIYAKYKKYPKSLMPWADFSHSVFFADSRGTLGFNNLSFNPKDNKIYGGGSEKEKGWEWVFFYLGEGKIEGERFKPVFLRGTKFNFIQGGSLEITSAPRDYIKIYFPDTLKKLKKEELEKGILAEIVEDTTKKRE